jgi:hypothetical protein
MLLVVWQVAVQLIGLPVNIGRAGREGRKREAEIK